MNTEILYILTATLFYYLVFIALVNKFAIRKWLEIDNDSSKTINYNLLALNLNIVILVFVSYDNLLNYFTFIAREDNSFLGILASGTIIIFFNSIVLLMSYLLSLFLKKIITTEKIIYLIPILWVTLNLILTKIINLYYETIISAQNFTIL